MIWQELKKKNWIDWVKIIVAIDIAGVGIGMVLGFDMHVFANIFGFVSRIIFGCLYVFVAVLIFKRVFPQKLAREEHVEASRMDEDIKETADTVKKTAQKLAHKAGIAIDKAHTKADDLVTKGEEFVTKRTKEAKDEIKKLSK